MKKITFILMLAIFGWSANAQWQKSGLDSSDVRSFVTHGNNIFAGTYNGVFLSQDNGDTWIAMNTGLTDTTVNCLAINGNNIFAGTWSGIFLSTNDGTSWTNVLTQGWAIWSLDVIGDSIFACDNGGNVNLSLNNGNTWTTMHALNSSIYTLVVSNNNIIIGTGMGVFLTADNGNTWTAVNSGLPINNGINTLAISGNNIFAGNYNGIFLSTNNGNSWIPIINGLADTIVYRLAISGSNIFAGTDNGVYLSPNNGNTWVDVNYGLPINSQIFSFGISGNNIFAGTYNNGIWKRALSEMTGIKEINNESNIAIYPNPTINNLTIDNLSQSATIEISNIQGQLIETLAASGNKTNVDVSALPSGVYVVEVKTEKGVAVKKFIKE